MGLKTLRLAKGLSLHKLADLSGLNYMKIYYIETGKIKAENIALKTALKLSRALDCRPEDLLSEVSEDAGI